MVTKHNKINLESLSQDKNITTCAIKQYFSIKSLIIILNCPKCERFTQNFSQRILKIYLHCCLLQSIQTKTKILVTEILPNSFSEINHTKSFNLPFFHQNNFLFSV